MEIERARDIIEKYKISLAEGTEGGTILRKSSLLTNSKGMIKFAYFTLLNALIDNNQLADDLKEDLLTTYSQLGTFVDDLTAEKYAKIQSDWQEKKTDLGKRKKDEQSIKQYIVFTHTLGTKDLFNELKDYIEELLRKT